MNTNQTKNTIKTVLKVAANFGIGFVIADVCRGHIPVSGPALKRICMRWGTLMTEMMVGEQVGNYTGNMIDSIFCITDNSSNQENTEENKPETVEGEIING